MARAKQTGRAEARRRFRQAAAEPADDATELDFGERKSEIGAGKESARPAAGPSAATTRPGFMTAFRTAYHPPRFREDIRHLPMLLRSRAFLAAVALILVGAVAVYLFPNYTGTMFIFQLVVLPQSALAPQLVAGFFAPRASYILGFLTGVLQTAAYVVVVTSDRFRGALEAIQPGSAPSFRGEEILFNMLSAAITGGLFAAMAAWYRRFLALSSPRRPPTRGQPSRGPAKGNPSRRPAGR